MPVYNHNGLFSVPINISTFVRNARNAAAPGGPLPLLPGDSNDLGTHQTALVNISPVAQITRAVGLITCAAVIYVSDDEGAVAATWIHHANTGLVTAGNVAEALAGLGHPPPASVMVIYAHPGNDNNYADSINVIAGQGINANNIVEIPNLPFSFFGVDNLARIG